MDWCQKHHRHLKKIGVYCPFEYVFSSKEPFQYFLSIKERRKAIMRRYFFDMRKYTGYNI
jgi:hypothetical protein